MMRTGYTRFRQEKDTVDLVSIDYTSLLWLYCRYVAILVGSIKTAVSGIEYFLRNWDGVYTSNSVALIARVGTNLPN